MATYKKKINLYESEEGQEVQKALRSMESDGMYMTESSYSADMILHPDGLVTFVDKHMTYLNKHPEVDPSHYLGNLRIMLKIRPHLK